MNIKSLGDLCLLKIASYCELSIDNPNYGIVEALEVISSQQASQLISLLCKSGHLSKLSLEKLVRSDFFSLDLSFAESPKNIFNLCSLLQPCLPQLIELNLNNSFELLDDDMIKKIVSCCDCLEQLNLTSLFFLNDSTVQSILCLSQLRYLNLSDCTNLTDDAFSNGVVSKKLELLDISRISGITAETLDLLSTTHCRQSLKSLCLDGCIGMDDNESNNWCFESLTSLQAKGIRSMRSSAWSHHLYASPHLVKVQLGECLIEADLVTCLLHEDSNEAICNMTEAHIEPDICSYECLDISWSEMPGCLAMALACASGKNLKSLALRCVSLDYIDVLVESDPSSSFDHNHGNKIHLIELKQVTFEKENMILSVLGSSCPNLNELNLSRCGENILGVKALENFTRSVGNHLVKLDISWTNVSDEGLLEIVTNCKALKALGLQGCKALTENAADIIASGDLLWVDLSWVNSMDTTAMENLVKKCPKLVAIDYYCENIEGKLSQFYTEGIREW